MNELATLDAFGALTEPATVKIQRRLPGPIERVWAYLTESERRRQWLAAGQMEMKVGAPFELVWRNDELSDPPGQRPAGFPEESRMQSRITELDPPHKLSFTWAGSGDVSFELERQGNEVLLTVIHRRLPDRDTLLKVRSRLAHAPRHSGRPRHRQGAGTILGRLAPPQAGIRPAAARLTAFTRCTLRPVRRASSSNTRPERMTSHEDHLGPASHRDQSCRRLGAPRPSCRANAGQARNAVCAERTASGAAATGQPSICSIPRRAINCPGRERAV